MEDPQTDTAETEAPAEPVVRRASSKRERGNLRGMRAGVMSSYEHICLRIPVYCLPNVQLNIKP